MLNIRADALKYFVRLRAIGAFAGLGCCGADLFFHTEGFLYQVSGD